MNLQVASFQRCKCVFTCPVTQVVNSSRVWRWEDEMVGWHNRLDGHEFKQAPGVGDGQGSLACCGPWGHKESDTTEWLNWTVWCTLSGVYVFYKWLCFVYFIVLYGIVQYLCFKPKMSATKHKSSGDVVDIAYCWRPFSSTISHPFSLLQLVTLLACSLNATPCMPAVVLYYCTFQGTIL